MNAEMIVVILIVGAAFGYVVISMVKKYKRLSTPTDRGGCNGNCGHDCCNCPFSKAALERKLDSMNKKNKDGCGCCGG